METLWNQRSHGPDSFLSLCANPEENANVGVEVHEDDVFWTGHGSPEPNTNRNPTHSSKSPTRTASPSPHTAALRRALERGAGILAALVEESGGSAAPFFRRRAVVFPAPASTSRGSFSSSSARMIPAKLEGLSLMPTRKMLNHSAPVNVAVPAAAARRPRPAADMNGVEDDGGEEEMLPPHEMLARLSMKNFSVLEGAGRTLKGRDLCRVRNAVLQKTGFLDSARPTTTTKRGRDGERE